MGGAMLGADVGGGMTAMNRIRHFAMALWCAFRVAVPVRVTVTTKLNRKILRLSFRRSMAKAVRR